MDLHLFFEFLNTRSHLPWLNAADVQHNRIVKTIHTFHFITFIFLHTLTMNINAKKNKNESINAECTTDNESLWFTLFHS